MDNSKETIAATPEMRDSRAPEDVLDKPEHHPIAPDQFDERYRTTKMEIWAYYACVCRQV